MSAIRQKPSPDHVCKAYATKKTSLAIRILDGDDDVILIEGNRRALEFFGRLLIAQAAAGDCGFQLGPNLGGQSLFSPDSRDVYIHRVPCAHQKLRKGANASVRAGSRRNGARVLSNS